MAKISFVLFVVALIAFLHAYEARKVVNLGEAFEKDLHKAEAMIAEELKAKKTNIQGLKSEVKTLSKSEVMLKDLGNAYKKDMDLRPYEKKLKNFSRIVALKKAPMKNNNKKPVSIIQSILKDFGLNGGRN
ncbi:hypothetical protein AtNW77_Chr3g0155401 [Arabidopsis thaliana]|uniref:Uncharacterized protein n=3 Tax=Arabidopsis TaxID=3701 RepID=A0A178V8E3_ARATH|nr:hypothetical protein ISN45_At03g000350 [Arabidopsis thaliana x Arabidopsis arenosa]KAG7629590.1 hypothetical protein ISN44_As03g000270 [Arabidopsis suecica]OAP01263.1 hypothetical protein AXX17_AT3G00290 [Arabidopsis thaliana]